MKSDLPISIVINTLNRKRLLQNTLESFQYLDYPNFEVIVVNGPSTDGTDNFLKTWSHRIKVGHCPEANLSMSRNIGISMASGDFVAFIDDDAIPESEWLTQGIAGFDHQEVAASGGKVFDPTGYQYQYQYANSNRLGNAKWQLTESFPHYCFPRSFEFPYLQGTNTIFRRNVLIQIGGFDEEYIYYLDETEVCLRLVDSGYVIRQLPNAYVHHKFAPSHIREKGVTKNLYPVLKSKIYFSNCHARDYLSQSQIDAENYEFIQNQRKDLQSHLSAGRLVQEDCDRFEVDVEKAWRLGMEAARQPPKLMTSDLMQRFESDRLTFKPFETIVADGSQMTIVLLCEDYPPALVGGIARFTQDKATALARLGHKVHVIALGHGHNTVDLEDGVWVHRILSVSQPLTPEAIDLNVPQVHWDQSQSFFWELCRIETHRPIIVVEAPIWNIVGIATLLSGRFKVVTSLMTTLKLSLTSRPDLTSNPQIMRTFVEPTVNLEQYLINSSHAVLAISQGIVHEIEDAYDLKIPADKLYISHLGMPDWSQAVPINGLNHNSELLPDASRPLKILFVGRLETRKGIAELLKVIPSLCDRSPKVEFHIVGDDTIELSRNITYRSQFEKKYGKLCQSQVKFYGKVSEEELRNHYSDCDVFVAPSRFESFGLIYVEAMMFSKPVVGCNVGGIPEVVADESTGLLAIPGDAASLEKSIDRLLQDPQLRQRLGKNGRQRYEQAFSDTRMAKSCLDLYTRLQTSHQAEVLGG
jgi:glycogen synthase